MLNAHSTEVVQHFLKKSSFACHIHGSWVLPFIYYYHVNGRHEFETGCAIHHCDVLIVWPVLNIVTETLAMQCFDKLLKTVYTNHLQSPRASKLLSHITEIKEVSPVPCSVS